MPSRFLTRTLPVLRALSAAARPVLAALACAMAIALPSGAAFAAEGVNVKHGKTVIVEGGTFAFGTTDVGSKQVRNFTVTNVGGSAIDLAGLSVTGAGYSVRSESTSIFPGKKASVVVELDTSTPGTPMATVVIPALGSDPFDFKVSASIVTPAPRIQVTSQGEAIENMGSLFIGNTIEGRSRSRSITIRNAGALTLNLSDPVLDGSGFTLTSKPKKTLAPGKSTRFNVRLDGAGVGAKTGTITITSNDPNQAAFKFIVDGAVGATGPDIAVSTPDRQVTSNTAVDLGTVPAGVDAVIPIRIRNVGNAPLILGEIEVSNPDSFQVTIPPDSTLAPGKTSTLFLTFLSAQGSAEGTISIPSNDPDESPFILSLSAEGQPAPDVQVFFDLAPDVDVEDGSDFLLTSVLANSQTAFVVNVRNAGSAPLTIGNAVATSVGGPPHLFSIISQPSDLNLDPGEVTQFTLNFIDIAGVEALYRGDVSFSNNDPTENPFNFRVGVFVSLNPGGSRPLPGSSSSLLIDSGGRVVRSGGVFDFGAAYKGRSDTREFTVSNMGSAPVTLGPATINGKGFTLVSQSDVGTPIPAGGSATFTVRMNADQVGPAAATITLTTASGELITILLTGKVE